MRVGRVEWPTVGLLTLCYFVWAVGTTVFVGVHPAIGVIVTGVSITLYSSLQHEIIHGHPFENQALNEALVFPSLNPAIPYQRFRDTHLAHHKDANLTDPYDDPESNYLDPGRWEVCSPALKALLSFNNTLSGRMLIGPLIGQIFFLYDELRLLRAGSPTVLKAWYLWALGLVPLILWLGLVGQMAVWHYIAATYLALAILRIRTFLEHQAHEKSRARSVIIEDRGLLALLFLNNNFHVVHHMHPRVPWYRLPALYRSNKGRYLRVNNGYVFENYWQIMRRHFFRAKDTVPHPLWRRG
ncbi:fatty acid desaturase [Litoreibacter roseus]|uniref:Fatty acid desaturase n=1 Tax=Litoreibacter roseus TaxID=2601869 RepID=A0A6N6JBR8_9RHOB|nr:fatty acid desaturase [Litoreibacter roseus]GFE63437.1 fatty acid desaturase [Litoreibacter roseus]